MCAEENNKAECTCGHSGDGKCHCCENGHEKYICETFDEIDIDEYINQLDDWD